MNKFYVLSNWITKLFYLQCLWLVGTLAGGVILGLVPSTISLYASIRQLYLGEMDLKLATYFIDYYKNTFKDSIVIGSLYTIAFIIVFSYLQFINATSDSSIAYLHILLYIAMIILFLIMMYIIPVYTHYDVKLIAIIKNGFFISLINIKYNIYLLSSLLAFFLILSRYQIIIVFFGISLPGFLNVFFCMKAFEYYEEKRTQYVNS